MKHDIRAIKWLFQIWDLASNPIWLLHGDVFLCFHSNFVISLHKFHILNDQNLNQQTRGGSNEENAWQRIKAYFGLPDSAGLSCLGGTTPAMACMASVSGTGDLEKCTNTFEWSGCQYFVTQNNDITIKVITLTEVLLKFSSLVI